MALKKELRGQFYILFFKREKNRSSLMAKSNKNKLLSSCDPQNAGKRSESVRSALCLLL